MMAFIKPTSPAASKTIPGSAVTEKLDPSFRNESIASRQATMPQTASAEETPIRATLWMGLNGPLLLRKAVVKVGTSVIQFPRPSTPFLFGCFPPLCLALVIKSSSPIYQLAFDAA
jgi:hypothetical protein